MRTSKLRGAMVALLLPACLAMATRLQAEERDSSVRRDVLKFNAVTGMNPLKGEVLALLDDKSIAKKLVGEAARMAKEKPQPFTYNATLILATAARKLKDYPAAETFYRLYLNQAKQLRSVEGQTTAYGGLIEVYYNNKKYVEAEKACKEVLELTMTSTSDEEDVNSINRFKSAAMEEMILAIARQGDIDRAIDLIDRILKNAPNSWLALDLKASVYRIGDKYQQAAKVYEETLTRLKDDKDIKKEAKEILLDDIRYKLSGLYVDLNQIDKAAEQLKTLLAKEPDNSTYNNDLGYIWADHDMNLAESEKLIRKAMEEERKLRRKVNPQIKPENDKDSAAYLDSLGWVLYKQKKYEEAKKYLQQAVEQEEGDHVEILDHLGDVLMALGQKSEAVAVWKKGVKATGDTKREQKRKVEVLKKIKANE
jgi:tetratricopeptide (TPR) repeat protein